MKKILTIIAVFISAASFAQKDSSKVFKVELDSSTWNIYFRNIDRINLMAGRKVPDSEIVLATKDTIQTFQQIFISQLNAQLPKQKK